MFTGIVEDIGTVKSIEIGGTSGRIGVRTVLVSKGISTGDSIAVDGVCLTVTRVDGDGFDAEVSGETLSVTTLGGLRTGARVNLERALTLSKPLGGHIVTGHIDGRGTIRDKRPLGGALDMEIEIPGVLMGQIVRKGSVAVDGISLTVAGLTERGFRVVLVPHTLKNTTLGEKSTGSIVNVETDIIGKYVERFLKDYRKGGITEGFLLEHGFIRKDPKERFKEG